MDPTNEYQPQKTEQKILEAAEKEFLRKGFAGARTTAIAEAAGVTHAMLHYYFRTKDKLFEKIIHEKICLLRDLLIDSLGSPDLSLFDKIKLMIDRHLDFVSVNPDLPRFLIGEVFYQRERMDYFIDVIKSHAPLVISSLQKQIDESANKGLCRKVDARILLLDILSLNIFSFIAAPAVNPLLGGIMENMDGFVDMRKKENIETIMRKIRP